MFRKVLIAEDFDTYSIAISGAVEQLAMPRPDHAAYCDEALLKIKLAIANNQPYDLLISDLSFKPGLGISELKSGIDLITAAKACDPNLKVIVFSIENRLHPIRHLLEDLGVDGFVLKGRNNIPEMHKAIRSVFAGDRYVSDEVSGMLRSKSLDEIEAYDMQLMQMLASGLTQDEIVVHLQQNNISPNSKSSIEKRLNRLKTTLGANTTVQMLLIAKDLGLV